MPGVFGVIDTTLARAAAGQGELVQIVRQMAAAMTYESFYSARLVTIPSLGACVGQVELNLTGSHHGDASGRAFAITTGERRHEVLEHAETGDDLVRAIAGKCAGFVADTRTGECALFNDRYGRERIYLHAHDSRVIFSSEAKAILAVAPQTREFDTKGLADFVASGCTLGVQSLYRGIEVLDPGTVLVVGAAGVRRRRVFSEADLEALSPQSEVEFLERLAESLHAAVGRSIRSSPSIAVSLTGGLDSRMIMASLDAPPGAIPCYTFGSMYRTTRDVHVARRVASACGQPHRVIELGRDFLEAFGEIFEHSVYVSDGYLGLPGAAEIYVNREARSCAEARMTGNWGGELMRGVRAFKFGVPKGAFIKPELEQCMRESSADFAPRSKHPISGALFNQIPLQGYGRYAIERSQVLTRTPFLADEVVDALYRAPSALRASIHTAIAVLRRRTGLLEIPTDTGALGAGGGAIRRSWRKAVIKAEYLTSHGAPDWIARLAAALPASFLETRFLGVDKFYHFRHWTRTDLAGIVRDTLTGNEAVDLGRWFDMPVVARLVDAHIGGKANHTDAIDKLMTLAVARKTLFKSPASRAGSHLETAAVCQPLTP